VSLAKGYAILAVGLTLAGCATGYGPGSRMALVHCSIQAEQESNTGFADGMLGPIYEYVSGDADRIAALEHQCMEAKGFHKVAAQ
jgi:hypothetical protein